MKNVLKIFAWIIFFNSLIPTAKTFATINLSDLGINGDNVKNVHFSLANGNVIINYDLIGNINKVYSVKIYLKKGNDSSYQYAPQMLTGDVGTGKFAGKNRQIIWAMNEEFPDGLPGKDYYFIVDAEEINQSSNFLTWIGVGVAAIAAAATYIVVNNKIISKNNSAEASFPPPPGRPK